MRRPTWNSCARLVLCSALVGASAAAEEPQAHVDLSCRPEAAPGRVLCELKYTANAGARLVWADALVVDAPSFARPLRTRVTPERFKETSAAERKLSLGFVAEKSGVGQVRVKARAVVCSGSGDQERCHPESHDVSAELRVGG